MLNNAARYSFAHCKASRTSASGVSIIHVVVVVVMVVVVVVAAAVVVVVW